MSTSRSDMWTFCITRRREDVPTASAYGDKQQVGQRSALLVRVLPLLHGRHGVLDVLVRVHGGVRINDLAGGSDHVGGAVGVLRMTLQHRVVGLHDAAVRVRGDGELVAAF